MTQPRTHEEIVMTYDYHITQLTPEAALAHTRRSMNIPENVGLGWTPYNYLVTNRAISHWACHTVEELNSWLSRNGFDAIQWSQWENGIRSAWLEKA